MFLPFPGNQRGQSIVQVLISIGLMGILMAAFATMMGFQSKETHALSEKLAALDLQKLLTASLADGRVCVYVLNNPVALTFDSTKPLPQAIDLKNPTATTAALYTTILPNPAPPPAEIPGPIAVQINKPASSISDTLVVKSIQLRIESGNSGSYSGNWIVSFDNSKSIRQIKPVMIATSLTADLTAPMSAKITGCQGSGFPLIGKYKDMTASRVLGTTYTNANSSPLFVSVTANHTSVLFGPNVITATVDGLEVASAALNDANAGLMPAPWVPRKSSVSFIVPAGSKYVLNSVYPGLTAIIKWLELK